MGNRKSTKRNLEPHFVKILEAATSTNYSGDKTLNMEFPPPWDIFPMEEFETAGPRNPGSLGMELMVQMRPNGRILDHFRVTVGGSELLTGRVTLSEVMGIKDPPDWIIIFSSWPRDIQIRRNMTSSTWVDIKDLIQANDARVELPDGVAVDSKEALDYLEALPDKTLNSAAVRWAVCVGEDGRPALILQVLPCPAHTFAGKPTFKG